VPCLKRQSVLIPSAHAGAFSLVELVIVIVIIGIIAAIAVPRISQAGSNSQANAIRANLTNVRVAIDHYYAEHYKYPGYDPTNGDPDGTWFVNQLLQYSDSKGSVSTGYSATFRFGPYLRGPFPTNPLNNRTNVAVKKLPATTVAAGSSGWIACLQDGSFDINADTTELSYLGFSADERIKVEMAVGAK
jgi:general secretion pathway protein G